MINKNTLLSEFGEGEVFVIACRDMGEFGAIAEYSVRDSEFYRSALPEIYANVERNQYKFPWGISVVVTEDGDITWDGYCELSWYKEHDFYILDYEEIWTPDAPEEPDDFSGLSGVSILDFAGFPA